MAREETSELEMMVDLVSFFPPWVGVILALLSYIILDVIAASEPFTLFTALASFGKYVFPPAYLIGAGISAWR